MPNDVMTSVESTRGVPTDARLYGANRRSEGHFSACIGPLSVRRLIVPEHATHPRCRKETFPELFVLDLRCEISQGLRCPGERRPRLLSLPASLAELADPAPDLPQFAGWSDLLSECFGFTQAIYRSFRVAFPFAQDRQRAQVRHPISLIRPCAIGETTHLLSGESFVPSSQQRFDLVVEVDAE